MTIPIALARPAAVHQAGPPVEVFPVWEAGQRMVQRQALAPLPEVGALRTIGVLTPDQAERITGWYTGASQASARDVVAAYEALADELPALARTVTAPRAWGGLEVRVRVLPTRTEPYEDAAHLRPRSI